MEHSSGSADRHALRATQTPRSESNDRQFLYRSRSEEQPGSGLTQTASESRPDDTRSLQRQSLDRQAPPIPRTTESNSAVFTRSLYRSRSAEQPGSGPTQSASENRPHDAQSLQRQSLDRQALPIPRTFERRPVSKSQSSDKIDPTTTTEMQPDLPLSPSRSSDGTFSFEAFKRSRSSQKIIKDTYSEQLPERTPVPENKPLEASTSSEFPTPPSIVAEATILQTPRSTELPGVQTVQSPNLDRMLTSEPSSHPRRTTEIWTPSSASSFGGYPYERSQPDRRDRVWDPRRPDDIDEITPVVASSYRLETLSRVNTGDRGSNQTNDGDELLRAMGVTEQRTLTQAEHAVYAEIMMDVIVHGGGKEEALRRITERSTQIAREREQVERERDQIEREREEATNRDVKTLLGALGIRNDDLGLPGAENYQKAEKLAETIVKVIRNNGLNKELNDASKEILKLAPKRSLIRSLVNPKMDTINWYDAAWRNEEAMSKLDTTKWGDSIINRIYKINQPLAGPANTRLGNLTFVALQALAGTAYTSYIEKGFASSTLLSSLEYAATARLFYTLFPNPINQAADTIQFQGVSIGLYEGLKNLVSHAHNATTSG